MKKRSIVIASVLKPMDDTRMTEKMGMSLLKSGVWDVHIVGFGKVRPEVQGISFHPLGIFSRLSLTRMFTPWRVLAKLFSIKPSAIIVTTHELLWVAVISKLFFRTKVYYDVRENYKLNILNTSAFPLLLRWPIGFYVRFKEWLFSGFIRHFLLAEKTYAHELQFVGQRFTIVENKSVKASNVNRKPVGETIHLLFSGTLDMSTGVFDAIELAKKLHQENQNIRLSVIGYASLPDVQKKIKQEASHSFIKLIGINSLVPHKKILEAISQADIGIIVYQSAPHTRNCIPTKLYEYLAHQLPILYDGNASWASMVSEHQGGISINFTNPNAQAILEALHSSRFHTQPPLNVTWESEEEKLLMLLGR